MDLLFDESGLRGCYKWAAVGVFLLSASASLAADFSFESAGARAGFGANSSSRSFFQVEGFTDWNLPWQWDLGAKWNLDTRLDLSAGWLDNQHQDAFIASLGPLFVLKRERFPLSLEAGLSPTVLSRSGFVSKDFGEPLQFTSHLGAYFDIAKRWRIGYRYQHMSNAALSNSNPGLNMHMFTISYRF